jgi:putative hydrolase of the HAD superfamily
MSPNIQAVFFDLGDTLIRTRTDIVEKICIAVGEKRKKPMGHLEYLTAFYGEWIKRQKPLDKELIKSITDAEREIKYWNDFFESLLPSLGVVSNEEGLRNILAKIHTDPHSFECFDGVHDILAELKEKGLKLGIISNAFPSAKSIIRHLELEHYFDHILLSYEIRGTKLIKPEPEIYQCAVDALNVDIKKSIFVDDRWAFVKAALELGMDAYLIDRLSPLKKNIKTKSLVPKIIDLAELMDIILGNDHQTKPALRPEIKKARGISTPSKMDILASA